ncbi:MAG: CPBP family intramembrane metalloprotease [Cardiobacteriaceae bacterium]|nr:CPBP family intramembrane metalloprotease [Cardiobacteriaceae bacterium]
MSKLTNLQAYFLSILALIIFAPAPSVGVLLARMNLDANFGILAWILAKIWLFVLPFIWLVFVEKNRLTVLKFKKDGVIFGIILGIIMLIAIWGSFYLFGKNTVDIPAMKNKLSAFHLTDISIYLACFLYWTVINSFLEEFIFRYFFFEKLEVIFQAQITAAILAAIIFTIHHSIALGLYVDWKINILASSAVFLAGFLWNLLFIKYRSLYPGYIAHIFADIGVFGLGFYLLFIA